MTRPGRPVTVDAVRDAWRATLGMDVSSVDTQFFEAGGHSTLVMVLQEHLEELAGRELRIEDLFEHTTIRAQAAWLSAPTGGSAPPPAPARSRERLLGLRRAVPRAAGSEEDA